MNLGVDFTPGRPLRAYGRSGQWRDFSTDDLVGRKLNAYEGWKCGMGVESLCINMDGDVFGATCQVGGSYGNVFGEFSIPAAFTTCPRRFCGCGADLFIPKYRSEGDAKLLRRTQALPTQIELRREDDFAHAGLERTHASEYRQVYWEIGRRCNFDCSYCWPAVHNNHERHKSLDELVGATQKVFDQFGKGRKLNFIISGGEPTLNPAFMDWVKFIASFGHHLSMHSNGSRLAPYYRELIHYGDLNLSVHFEFWNREKMLRNIREITEEKVSVQNQGVGHLEVKIMMAPGRRAETLELEDRLREIPHFKECCTWSVVPIRGGDTGEDLVPGYGPEDHALFGDRT